MSEPASSIFPQDLFDAAARVLDAGRRKGLKVATAESCTGGLVASLMTEIAGSSDVVERGFVTYSNEAKIEVLGVPEDVIARHGAVSAETAAAMAAGAIERSRADVAVSITGVAGPGGGTKGKPVGLVWFGAMRRGQEPRTLERRFGELGRANVRLASLRQALDLLSELLAED
jgi:nicotinamide-nucleotide amidase